MPAPSLHNVTRKMFRTASIVLCAIFIPLVLIASLEWYLRHRGTGEPAAARGIERAIRLREHHPLSVVIEKPDADFLRESAQNVAPGKYVLRADDDGFILPSRRFDKPDFTVVFLGGSTTECVLVDEELRFPALTGAILSRKSGRKVNSYNGGMSGNDSLHSLDVLLNKVIPLKPNAVVMMHNINDLVVLLLERSYWNSHPRRSPVYKVGKTPLMGDVARARLERWIPATMRMLASWSSHGPAVRAGADEFASRRGTAIAPDREAMLSEFEMNLRTFIELCRIRGITPILMTQASRLTDDPDKFIEKLAWPMPRDYGIGYAEFKALFNAFNDRIRAVSKRSGVMVIDLDRLVPKTDDYLYDLVHYHSKGSAYVARIISRELLPLVRSR